MRPTVRALVREQALGLRLLDPTTRLDLPLSWVHSSDLLDPSPFVAESTMLLTTGTQFDDAAGPPDYDAYVERLVGAGVVALGFGTEVRHRGTPVELVLAASARGVPVVEVPYRTPFIAVVRWAADLIAQEARARDLWTLRAQRAVSVAAIGDGGLEAVLRVLAGQLSGAVLLFGSEGARRHVVAADRSGAASEGPPAAAIAPDDPRRVDDEAVHLLRRGARASSTVVGPTSVTTLQTLGRRDELRGVLAVVTSRELDLAARAVVTSVVALAETTLDRDAARLRGQRELWAQVWALLVSGRVDVAQAITRSVGVGLADGPSVVALIAPPERSAALAIDAVERVAAGRSDVFVAPHGEQLVVLATPGAIDLVALAAAHGLRVGVSDVVGHDRLAGALGQARRALALALAGSGAPGHEEAVVPWARVAAGGLVAALWTDEAARLADTRLAPVRDLDDGDELLECSRVWLEHNGAWEPAARQLGLHRHSLRARVAKVERALGLSLDGFADRAELWALLQATG
jgi:purine catabolism regulator